MKKLIIFVIFLNLLFVGSAFAQDVDNIDIYIYGGKVSFPNKPTIINNRTFVPLRSIFEYLGAQIDWNPSTMSVIARRGKIEVKLTIGSTTGFVNGKSLELSDEPRIINGSTYVPLRFVSESFKQDVKWDDSTKTISIGKELQPRDISEIVSPAVVYIEIHDKKDKIIKSGSGFIVDKTGIVVTNFHVIDNGSKVVVNLIDNRTIETSTIDNGSKAVVKLIDGRTFETSTVIGYNQDRDIAVLKIDAADLPTVSIGNSDEVENGDRVVTIGSPLGLENSISDGLVSNNNRTIDNFKYIQISAAISHGSSGGALIDEKNAKVIGITTLGFIDGQNINMAIPINEYKTLSTSNKFTFDDVYQKTHVVKFDSGNYYEGDIKQGVFDGIGFFQWADGDNYYGDFVNNKRTGKGVYTWVNKDQYVGNFVDGDFEGLGKFTSNKGFIYEGNYKNGFSNGFGKATWPNGDIYIGDWKDDNVTGYGTYYFLNGQVVKGNWLNGQFIN